MNQRYQYFWYTHRVIISLVLIFAPRLSSQFVSADCGDYITYSRNHQQTQHNQSQHYTEMHNQTGFSQAHLVRPDLTAHSTPAKKCNGPQCSRSSGRAIPLEISQIRVIGDDVSLIQQLDCESSPDFKPDCDSFCISISQFLSDIFRPPRL